MFLKPPKGYAYSYTCHAEPFGEGEFRPPIDGEPYLLPDGKSVGAGPHRKPRLILKPDSPAPSVSSIYGKTLEELKPRLEGHRPLMEGGRPVVRLPKKGEWYFDRRTRTVVKASGDWMQWSYDTPWERLILSPRRRIVFDIIGENLEPREGELACDVGPKATSVWKSSGIYGSVNYILSAPPASRRTDDARRPPGPGAH